MNGLHHETSGEILWNGRLRSLYEEVTKMASGGWPASAKGNRSFFGHCGRGAQARISAISSQPSRVKSLLLPHLAVQAKLFNHAFNKLTTVGR